MEVGLGFHLPRNWRLTFGSFGCVWQSQTVWLDDAAKILGEPLIDETEDAAENPSPNEEEQKEDKKKKDDTKQKSKFATGQRLGDVAKLLRICSHFHILRTF